jgi:hypothetical protein
VSISTFKKSTFGKSGAKWGLTGAKPPCGAKWKSLRGSVWTNLFQRLGGAKFTKRNLKRGSGRAALPSRLPKGALEPLVP